ncbi:MAG TPA: ATP-binding protein [Candidatus Limnocylindria bacterium]
MLPATDLTAVGRKAGQIDVRIGYKIIELFSEGLYSSATKAIEELVSNGFDAGALNIHVLLAADLTAPDASIAVIDDGTGMDPSRFEQHWLIGVSNKRDPGYVAPLSRKQIGKFGIGKLATYVLANRLTHISKRDGKYFAVTMDYRRVPASKAGKNAMATESVPLDLRELSETQAKTALEPWLFGEGDGYTALRLFGAKARKSWTAAIMTELKPMAGELRRGRLKWVLESAIPLRDDFHVYLNGEAISRSKLKLKRVGRWVLGTKDVDLPEPAPDGEKTVDRSAAADAVHGVTYSKLGRVTGYIEVYADPIDTGKSEEIERSNGFFVYVRDRLVNTDDPGFGIDRNKLRHGTFSRFRMVLHADGLDDELRSSRETIREGILTNIARNVAHAGFNLARSKLEQHWRDIEPGAQVSRRVASTPASLTRRPLAAALSAFFEGSYVPRYLVAPGDLKPKQQAALIERVRESGEGADNLIKSTVLEQLAQEQPFAVLDIEGGVLRINTLHPFVAYFLDEYEDEKSSVPLELVAVSEVLLEASLVQTGLERDEIVEILDQRDALLRELARGSSRRNARTVAQALADAATDQRKLELELIAAFDSMGFSTVPLGGSNKADGVAKAHLSGQGNKPQTYTVSLEAKSKVLAGTKVTAKAVGVATIARHREDLHADHAVVVGPDFPTKDEHAALVKELAANRKHTSKTITLLRISDAARLVRLVPLKRVGLNRLRNLFETASTPDEAKKWIDALEAEQRARPLYRQILETIFEEQEQDPNELVEFGGLRTALRRGPKVDISQTELIETCTAMSRLVPDLVTIQGSAIEINQRPDNIMKALAAAIGEYPSSERKEDAK